MKAFVIVRQLVCGAIITGSLCVLVIGEERTLHNGHVCIIVQIHVNTVSFILSTRMIVDHYYRHIPATDDGTHLENAWNSTSILPVSEGSNLELTENIE